MKNAEDERNQRKKNKDKKDQMQAAASQAAKVAGEKGKDVEAELWECEVQEESDACGMELFTKYLTKINTSFCFCTRGNRGGKSSNWKCKQEDAWC